MESATCNPLNYPILGSLGERALVYALFEWLVSMRELTSVCKISLPITLRSIYLAGLTIQNFNYYNYFNFGVVILTYELMIMHSLNTRYLFLHILSGTVDVFLILQETERVVSKKEGMDFAREYGCLFLECSAKTRVNVEQCFEELVLKV